MPEEIPDCPKKPNPAPEAGRPFEIELITPMFGGGVEPRTNDPSFPIRTTAIRGQLQFWWRATVGAQYADRQALRAAQSAIWGSTEQASRVEVRVQNVEAANPQRCATFEPDRNAPGKYRSVPTWNPPFNNNSLSYALFPFQGQLADGRTRIEVEPAACNHKASFRLILRCHKDFNFEKDVEPALHAWILFGGLGSRTRRGCGSVRCKALEVKDRNELMQKLKGFLQPSQPVHPWPTLAEAILVGPEQTTAIPAWDQAIELLRDFRQGVGFARNPGQQPNRPGRSRWPEPETIRRVTKRRAPLHQRLEHVPDNAFLRAEIGLPIVFHFKDERPGDPPDTILYAGNGSDGEKRERMASPLILKARALGNGKFVPIIMRLKAPSLEGVDLR